MKLKKKVVYYGIVAVLAFAVGFAFGWEGDKSSDPVVTTTTTTEFKDLPTPPTTARSVTTTSRPLPGDVRAVDNGMK